MFADLFSLDFFDLVFVICGVVFNLSITAVFIAQKQGFPRWVRRFGILMLSTGVPLGFVFVYYINQGRAAWILIYLGIIFLYIVVELLLDFVLRFDFRSKAAAHVPYIILEYLALFGFIGISFAIHPGWGYIVTITFWILLGALIYLYSDKILSAIRRKG